MERTERTSKPYAVPLKKGERYYCGGRSIEVKSSSYPVTLMVRDEFNVDRPGDDRNNATDLPSAG